MRGPAFVLLLLLAACSGTRHGTRAAGKMAASPASAKDLDAFEQLLVDKPDPARLRAALFSLTRYPHVFGVANVVPQITSQMASSLQPFGNVSSVKVESFTALSTLPLLRHVLLQPNASAAPVELDLDEKCVPEDPTSCLADITPLWAGYSPETPNGEPTPFAPVVYANYCREQDYEYLETRGISVKDTIVLCRYGAIFRAQKAQFAEARGARGVLVYSDPMDDGFMQAEEFPGGAARPPTGGQRGTYCYGQLCPGDPDPNRTVPLCGVNILPKIPIQPISWSAALPILQALGGEPVITADGWQGGLPLHYHFGPGPAAVSMQLTVNSTRREGYNIISTIEGSGDLANEVVALGCHTDAWVIGASDPLSGQAVMIELARVMGLMREAGWSPRRTIHFLAWDGEEYNLLGSTNFVDTKGELLSKRYVAYVNIDGIVGNWFPDNVALSLSASPVLADVFLDAVSKTPSPVNSSQTVAAVFDGTFSVLGDGSDYCSFINRLGIASLDISWGSPNLPSPQYHSRYDSFFLMNNVTDPQFKVHKASVTLVGLIMYHLSTDTSIHFSPAFAAAQYANYKSSLVAQFPMLQGLDWSGFDSALDQFSAAAISAQALVNSSDPTVNGVLASLDRQFLYEPGLPGRTYFRHVMQAPDLLNDYSSQVFPGVAYYAAANDLPHAQEQLNIIADLLVKAGQGITAIVPPNRAVTIAVIVVAVSFFIAIVLILILYLRRRSQAHRKYTELPGK